MLVAASRRGRGAGARGGRRHRAGLGGGHATSAPASGSRPTTWSPSGSGSRTPMRSTGYFTVDDELPADLELTRSVAAGELLPRARSVRRTRPAWSRSRRRRARAGPAERRRPATSSTSTSWRRSAPTPDRRGRSRRPTGPALAGATVVDAPELASSFGTSGKRQLVLAVPEADAPAFFALLARYDAPSLTVSGADEGRPAARRRRRLGDAGARPPQRPPRPRRPQALRRRRRPARDRDLGPGRHGGRRHRGARVRPRRRRPPRAARRPCGRGRPGDEPSTGAGRPDRHPRHGPGRRPRGPAGAITTDHEPLPEPPAHPDEAPTRRPTGG